MMQISLPAEAEDWLRKRVTEGPHASITELVEVLIAEHRLAELAIDNDDHAWAKPAIDEGLASLSRGEGSSLDTVEKRLQDRLAAPRTP